MSTILNFLKSQFFEYVKIVDETIVSSYPFFTVVGTKLGVSSHNLSVGLSMLFAVFAFFGLGVHSLTMLLGFAYPTYKSFKALRNNVHRSEHVTAQNARDSLLDDEQWLTYWVVFGFMCTAETTCSFLVGFIPFYYVFKLLLLIWMMHPVASGASFVYRMVVGPILMKWEPTVDASIEGLSNAVDESIGEAATSMLLETALRRRKVETAK